MDFSKLCTPWEHRLSRRRWLGYAAGATAGALGWNGLTHAAVAEDLRKKEQQVLFIWLDGGITQITIVRGDLLDTAETKT